LYYVSRTPQALQVEILLANVIGLATPLLHQTENF